MKWLIEKYEWLFYLLYREVKKVYPKNDDLVRYPIIIINTPVALLISYLTHYCFDSLTRTGAMVLGLCIIMPQFYYFTDDRVKEIEERYEAKNKE